MTATAKQDQQAHFRGKARPGRRVPVTYQARGTGETLASMTCTIGVGGAVWLRLLLAG